MSAGPTENRPWSPMGLTPSLPIEKPWNGDLVEVRFSDEKVRRVRFIDPVAEGETQDLTVIPDGYWRQGDGSKLPVEIKPIEWREVDWDADVA